VLADFFHLSAMLQKRVVSYHPRIFHASFWGPSEVQGNKALVKTRVAWERVRYRREA
jgi:hypothetical protein